VPRLDDFWPLLNGRGEQVGVARWAVWSYALDTSLRPGGAIAVGGAEGEGLVRAHGGGQTNGIACGGAGHTVIISEPARTGPSARSQVRPAR
jgi:hypothetical protein